MPATPTFPLYDRILGGELAATLTELKAAGLSIPSIRDELRDAHSISVSIRTVARWMDDLGLVDKRVAS